MSNSDSNKSGDKVPPNGGDDGSGMFTANDGRVVEIRNVWESNLEEEMANIREILETHPYIGMVCNLCIGLLFLYVFIFYPLRYLLRF